MAFTFTDESSIRRRLPVVAGGGSAASARKLAASLWQMAATSNCGEDVRWKCGLSDVLGFEFCSAPSIAKSSSEGVTKWDYSHFESCVYRANKPRESVSVASTAQARSIPKRINEVKTEQLMVLKDDVRRARKDCKKMHILYTKLMADISETKSSARKFMHDYEREKKSRELLEDLCTEQAKELEAYKHEIKELRIECGRIQLEMNEERKMLQIAEALREERAQMKLFDAKWILEDKYSQMSNLIADVKALLGSFDITKDENVMINDIQDVLSMIPKYDEMFTNIKDANHECQKASS